MAVTNRLALHKIEELIAEDSKHVFTLLSILAVILVCVNLVTVHLLLVGLIAFAVYFVTIGTFLGRAFFLGEEAFIRFALGILLSIMLLGFVGWIFMIIYDLEIVPFALVLLVTTIVSSVLNQRMRRRYGASK